MSATGTDSEIGYVDCPDCAERIRAAAIKCRFCGRRADPDARTQGREYAIKVSDATNAFIVLMEHEHVRGVERGAEDCELMVTVKPSAPEGILGMLVAGLVGAEVRVDHAAVAPPLPDGPAPRTGPAPSARSEAVSVPATGTNGMAIASMVLGIVWIYWIGSILALVFGYIALNQIKEREGQAGSGFARAGIVLGWIGMGVLALIILVAVVSGPSSTSSY